VTSLIRIEDIEFLDHIRQELRKLFNQNISIEFDALYNGKTVIEVFLKDSEHCATVTLEVLKNMNKHQAVDYIMQNLIEVDTSLLSININQDYRGFLMSFANKE
jgi:hypothetical protein